MPPRRSRPSPAPAAAPVAAYTHSSQTRKNIPPAGLAAQGRVREVPRHAWSYDPHLPPTLVSDATGAEDETLALLDAATTRKLTAEEAGRVAAALRQRQPWLEWATKREAPRCVVDPVALHIHERVSAEAVLRAARREGAQRDLFADPRQPYREALQFYQHDVNWANRLILGDSLQVMASLARREDLAGKVQMIYLDPPYGIRFASNFQSEVGRRDVKDKEQDLTREPETVKAYRDTWTLGVHSYLAYLRDRLLLARELLTDSGSIFVQISDENLHRVRCVMDEVFGADNFCSVITFKKTAGANSPMAKLNVIGAVSDYLLWYAKDGDRLKYRQVFERKSTVHGESAYSLVDLPSGERRRLGAAEQREPGSTGESGLVLRLDNLTSPGWSEKLSAPMSHNGGEFRLSGNLHWKTTADGVRRLSQARRVEAVGNSLAYVRYLADFPVVPRQNLWTDTATGGFGDDKHYVVQTVSKVIERCMLMTTEPGDLVLDPTCGSGTTAVVAEQWGRRWITTDTSRVAVSIARQRLLTAKYDYFRLREDVPNGTAYAGGAARAAASSTRPFRTSRSRASRRTPHSIRSSPGTSPRSTPRWPRSTARCLT